MMASDFSMRAKWRALKSGWRSAPQKVLDRGNIVRDGRIVGYPMEYVECLMKPIRARCAQFTLGALHRLPHSPACFVISLIRIKAERTNSAVLRTLSILFTRLERARLFLAEFLFFKDFGRVVPPLRTIHLGQNFSEPFANSEARREVFGFLCLRFRLLRILRHYVRSLPCAGFEMGKITHISAQ